jgi:hypothetical protein
MKKEVSVSKPEPIDYTFDGNPVHFELFGDNVMVNATEMAKIFDKKVEAFMRNEGTILFIEECLKSENSRFLNINSEEDLVISRQKSGTWMHRVLALKFAAWLSPKFELWVFVTIDHILFGNLKKMETMLKESAGRRVRLNQLMSSLLANPDFLELQKLQIEERQGAYLRSKMSKKQRDFFEESLFNS